MKRKFNNLNINYRYTYNKQRDKVVLLLHGWGGSLNSFRFLEKFLIENGFSVINLDFPGFGASDLPPQDFEMQDYYKIVSELLDYEKVESVFVVAHSFGGRVSILLSALEPKRVKKLVLCGSAGLKPKFSLSKQIKIFNYKIAKKLKSIGLIKRDLINYGSEDYKALPEQMKPVFCKIINSNLENYLGDITAQTLLVWGTNDKDTPLYMAKKMNKKIKDSAIVTFDGCGHFCYLEQPEKFEIILKKFFE